MPPMSVLELHLVSALVVAVIMWTVRSSQLANERCNRANEERERRLLAQGWKHGHHGHLWPPPPRETAAAQPQQAA